VATTRKSRTEPTSGRGKKSRHANRCRAQDRQIDRAPKSPGTGPATAGGLRHYLSDVDHRWEGDRLVFSGKAKGFRANGTVEVTEAEVIIDGKLPLIAKPFEPRIRSTIEREAEGMFGVGPASTGRTG